MRINKKLLIATIAAAPFLLAAAAAAAAAVALAQAEPLKHIKMPTRAVLVACQDAHSEEPRVKAVRVYSSENIDEVLKTAYTTTLYDTISKDFCSYG